MPYVPSEKTVPAAPDRRFIDAALEPLAQSVATEVTNNFSLRFAYKKAFIGVSSDLSRMLNGFTVGNGLTWDLAKAIYDIGAKYGYEGAYLGEFNYAFTRFIQRVPQIKVSRGDWKDELRYWLYAETVTALKQAEDWAGEHLNIGVDGVFRDIKDEYKRRMNTAYEAAQIVKSGDCYDGPYYTRLVEVVDETGKPVGHMEVMMKRSEETLHKDVLDLQLVLREKALPKKRASRSKK